MKKITAAICVILTAIICLSGLVSCSGAGYADKVATQLKTPFEYTAETDGFGFTYKKEDGKATMTVISPETLAGLVLEKTAAGITASYDGLVVTLPAAAAEKLFTLDSIFTDMLAAIEAGTYESASGDGIVTLTAKGDGYSDSVCYDTGTGKITSACRDAGENRITFSIK